MQITSQPKFSALIIEEPGNLSGYLAAGYPPRQLRLTNDTSQYGRDEVVLKAQVRSKDPSALPEYVHIRVPEPALKPLVESLTAIAEKQGEALREKLSQLMENAGAVSQADLKSGTPLTPAIEEQVKAVQAKVVELIETHFPQWNFRQGNVLLPARDDYHQEIILNSAKTNKTLSVNLKPDNSVEVVFRP